MGWEGGRLHLCLPRSLALRRALLWGRRGSLPACWHSVFSSSSLASSLANWPCRQQEGQVPRRQQHALGWNRQNGTGRGGGVPCHGFHPLDKLFKITIWRGNQLYNEKRRPKSQILPFNHSVSSLLSLSPRYSFKSPSLTSLSHHPSLFPSSLSFPCSFFAQKWLCLFGWVGWETKALGRNLGWVGRLFVCLLACLRTGKCLNPH